MASAEKCNGHINADKNSYSGRSKVLPSGLDARKTLFVDSEPGTQVFSLDPGTIYSTCSMISRASPNPSGHIGYTNHPNGSSLSAFSDENVSKALFVTFSTTRLQSQTHPINSKQRDQIKHSRDRVTETKPRPRIECCVDFPACLRSVLRKQES